MRYMIYHKEDPRTKLEDHIDPSTSDSSTTEFKEFKIAHIETDEEGFITLYAEDQSQYLVLSPEDVQEITKYLLGE